MSLGLLLVGAVAVVLVALRGGADVAHPSAPVVSAGPVRPSQPPTKRDPNGSAVGAAQNSRSETAAPFTSLPDCEAYVKRHPRAAQRGPRVGSWNIRWFPNGTSHGKEPETRTDLPWLACAIASLDVDVLAVEEITQGPEGRGALLDVLAKLDVYTHGSWRAELDECAGSGRQHVGFLYDSRHVALSEVGAVAGLNPGNGACALNLRPGFGAYARFVHGPDLWLVAVHLDSGVTARDFDHRALSISRLGGVALDLAARTHDDDLLMLGDFNTMGCKGCEGGDVSAEDEIARIDALLNDAAFSRLPMPEGRACSHYYRGHGGLLDHVVARAGMGELAAHAQVEAHGLCALLGCRPIPRSVPQPALARLSDHCPIVVQLEAADSDRETVAHPRHSATHR
jgi:endonuclease/exonuclease/phosphatase family metal-dependent hydrolase